MAIPPQQLMIGMVEGTIGWIIFNNPSRHNAVSVDMWKELSVILERFELDSQVRVIVLRGAGDKAFVSGADISEFENERTSVEARSRYEKAEQEALQRLE